MDSFVPSGRFLAAEGVTEDALKTDVIDADAHVVESERVWDYLEGAEKKFRPTLVPSPENPQTANSGFSTVKILGNKFPSPDERSQQPFETIWPGSRDAGGSA